MADFSTSQYAATVAGITPAEIGVPATNFVKKSELVATNKFDNTKLVSYQNHDFIKVPDVIRGGFGISLIVNSDVTGRETVQINNNPAGASAFLEVNVGETVTIKCNLQSGDVFDGWYEGTTKISSAASYTFTVQKEMSLIAKAFFIDATPNSFSVAAKDSVKAITIKSNVSWKIESN